MFALDPLDFKASKGQRSRGNGPRWRQILAGGSCEPEVALMSITGEKSDLERGGMYLTGLECFNGPL